jgi:hypothetical protein
VRAASAPIGRIPAMTLVEAVSVRIRYHQTEINSKDRSAAPLCGAASLPTWGGSEMSTARINRELKRRKTPRSYAWSKSFGDSCLIKSTSHVRDTRQSATVHDLTCFQQSPAGRHREGSYVSNHRS